MDVLMASMTQSDEVLLCIVSMLTSKIPVMYLKIRT
jgi:hypothetical protein